MDCSGRNLVGVQRAGIYAAAIDKGVTLPVDRYALRHAVDNQRGQLRIRGTCLQTVQCKQTVILPDTRNADKGKRIPGIRYQTVAAAATLDSRIQRCIDTDGIIRGEDDNFIAAQRIQNGSKCIAVCVASINVIIGGGIDYQCVTCNHR